MYLVFEEKVLAHLLTCGREIIDHREVGCQSWKCHTGSHSKRPDIESLLLEEAVGFHAPVHVAHTDHSHAEWEGGHDGGHLGLQSDKWTSGSEGTLKPGR